MESEYYYVAVRFDRQWEIRRGEENIRAYLADAFYATHPWYEGMMHWDRCWFIDYATVDECRNAWARVSPKTQGAEVEQ